MCVDGNLEHQVSEEAHDQAGEAEIEIGAVWTPLLLSDEKKSGMIKENFWKDLSP